ncbi:hypothetical protein Tco_0454608 [Tanacetum coccineum]
MAPPLSTTSEILVEVRNMKNKDGNIGGKNDGFQGYKQAFWKNNIYKPVKYVFKSKVLDPKPMVNEHNMENNKSPNKSVSGEPPSSEIIWKVSKENVVEIRKNANKYIVLSEEENEDNAVDPFLDKRLLVDEFIKKTTTHLNEKVMSDDEDVYENMNQAVNNIITDEVLGKDCGSINVESH